MFVQKNKKTNKSLKIKIISRIVILLVVLFVIIDIIFALSFRQESISEAKIRSKTIAKVVRDSLTSLMAMGVIQNRKIFIRRLKKASKQVVVTCNVKIHRICAQKCTSNKS